MPMNKLIYLTVIILISITTCNYCDDKQKSTNNNNKKSFNVKYFSKRKICTNIKTYYYYNPIQNTKEEFMKNFFKVSYYKSTDKIAIEASYKDMDTPVGLWFYYLDNGKKEKEVLYKDGKKVEESIFEYNIHNLLQSHTKYTYSSSKKLAFKSLYFYNYDENTKKRLLAKTENYNGAILDEYIVYEYNKEGYLSKRSIYLYNDLLKSYDIYNYKNNLLSKQEIYNKEDKIIAYITYQYDKNKNLIQKKQFEKKSRHFEPVKILFYKFNDKNTLMEKQEKIKIGNKYNTYTKKYSYDEMGCYQKPNK